MTVPSKNLKFRAQQRERVRAQVLTWYLGNSNGIPPDTQCEVERAHGVVEWWLSPPIIGIDNPMVVERPIGDGWGIEVDVLPKTY
jgi:hypothetical protein